MNRIRLALATVAACLATAVVAAPAPAAPVTIGSPLTAPFVQNSCAEACTLVTLSLDEQAAVVRSPVDGAVVRWSMLMGSPGFQYKLRVMSEAPGLNFTGAGTSAPGSVSGPGLETFPTNLPIKAGQLIGIDLQPGASLGYFGSMTPADSYGYFVPPLSDGQSRTTERVPGEVAFNAVIQPRPMIGALSPASGSFKGGTAVTITGTDLNGTTAVAFGTLPAQSFTVVSDTQVTAVAPPTSKPEALPVTVTTIAGTAISPTSFQSQACKVPQLKGKKLKGAKKRARKALCKVGKVRKIKGATAKTGKVVKQRPKAGKLLAPGAKVRVTLAP